MSALTQHGLQIKSGKLVADGKNPEATRQFIATLRGEADKAEKRAAAVTASKARSLLQNARAARRDADWIERSLA